MTETEIPSVTIALLVMTDGRDDCLKRTLASIDEHVTGSITSRIIHDDTGDQDHARMLADTYPNYMVIGTPARSGFGGAIRSAWSLLPVLAPEAQWTAHWEDDFIASRPIDLDVIAGVMDRHPYLANMVLRRQPWNDEERAAGGVVEVYPEGYTEKSEGDLAWLEHRMFWSTNPALYRMTLLQVDWPEGQHSEGHFGPKLRAEGTAEASGDDIQFAFWGARDSGIWVEHIGHERVGTGY